MRLPSLFTEEVSQAELSVAEQFERIVAIYPHVKLNLFNEATIGSILCAVSAQLAVAGQYLSWSSFQRSMESIAKEYPDRIYGLRQRHGGRGYVTLRSGFE